MNKIKYSLIPLFGILVILVVIYIFLVNKPSPNGQIPQITITPTAITLPTLTPAPQVSIEQSRSEQDQGLYDEYIVNEARLRPDLTVNNNAPFENDTFRIETQFVVANPGYFKILIFLKKDDQQNIQPEVIKWFKSIGIPDEALEKLVIEYSLFGMPKAE